jgi:hypothetical protein
MLDAAYGPNDDRLVALRTHDDPGNLVASPTRRALGRATYRARVPGCGNR